MCVCVCVCVCVCFLLGGRELSGALGLRGLGLKTWSTGFKAQGVYFLVYACHPCAMAILRVHRVLGLWLG